MTVSMKMTYLQESEIKLVMRSRKHTRVELGVVKLYSLCRGEREVNVNERTTNYGCGKGDDDLVKAGGAYARKREVILDRADGKNRTKAHANHRGRGSLKLSNIPVTVLSGYSDTQS